MNLNKLNKLENWQSQDQRIFKLLVGQSQVDIRIPNICNDEKIIYTKKKKKLGTPLFEGLDFKQAIARTPAIVGKIDNI